MVIRNADTIQVPSDREDRLNYILDLSWLLFLRKVANHTLIITNEHSTHALFAPIVRSVGTLFCTEPDDVFTAELAVRRGRHHIDLVCTLGDVSAAVEMKCFRTQSEIDLDMYEGFKDIERLQGFDEFHFRRFICLTDNPTYSIGPHRDRAVDVSWLDGTKYEAGTVIDVSWAAERKLDVRLNSTLEFNWVEEKGWYFLNIDLPEPLHHLWQTVI
ncbi:MAG: hypothetical protein JW846_10785 [Dehalococcoidia bacterium]|nr:hypothetical protein [Dehalococcoidia bacterium]